MTRRSGSGRQPKARSYHHGDLKAALVESASAILREQGLEALTLRAVARRAGVSAAAPYRHFADRRALVAAVAEQGFRRLGQAMAAGLASGVDRAGLRQVARAYVAFGIENAAEYRVMFGSELADGPPDPTLRATSRRVLEFVSHGIRGLQQAGAVGPGDPWLMAVTTWSMLHGLVLLIQDGQTERVAPDVETLVSEATRLMMFGLVARPASAPPPAGAR